MDFKKIYILVEDEIDELTETAEAEAALGALLSKLKETDPELFFTLDSAIGTLARAYEKQGFIGCMRLICNDNLSCRSENKA